MKAINRVQKAIITIGVSFLLFSSMSSAYSQPLSRNNDAFIAEQKSKEAQSIAPYSNDIAQIAAVAKQKTQAPDIQNYIHQLQVRSILSNPVSPALLDSSTGQILIFVSATMPEESLMQWFLQAQKIHAAVILRGFIHDSLLETKKWIKPFIDNNNNRGGIQINPIAFERYGIQQVPAVVAMKTTVQSFFDTSSMPFDVVYGNVSLSKSLQIIVDQGDSANGVAKNALNQLKAGT